MKPALAVFLVFLMSFTSCADKVLPYIQLGTTEAIQILQLVSAFQGKQLNPADVQAVQNVSAEAKAVFADIQIALTAYDTNKSSGTLAALTASLQAGYSRLSDILTNLRVIDPQLQARIEAGVLSFIDILQTIAAFKGVTVTPTANSRFSARMPIQAKKSIKDLKAVWNAQVAQGSPAVVIP